MFKTLRTLAGCMMMTVAAGACYSGGNNCFPAGTKIRTPDGEARVETVKIGDPVMALDPGTGKEIVAHVVKTHVHHHDASLERLTLSDGAVLEVTPEHPLHSATRKGWAKAGELVAGELLTVRDAKGGVTGAEILSKVSEKNSDDVYNLETDAGNYFAEGVLAKYY